MEPVLFNRIVELLINCPHFRGLDMYVEKVSELQIYSAQNILGIQPQDWDRIKQETNLFNSLGNIVPVNWEKVVYSTTR